MRPTRRPPRWAEALLSRWLGSGLSGAGVLGDLQEEFDERAIRSPRLAEVWYAGQAISIALRFAVRRHERDGKPAGGAGMDAWKRDARYAVRRMLREPGFTAVVLLTVTVAVGANAAIFSAVRPVVTPRLPFPEPDRLVRIWEQNTQRGWTRSSASWHDARDWAEASRSFESMGVYTIWEGNLVTDDTAERIRYALAEPGFFRVMGTEPLLGRTLVPEEIDPSLAGVVILSEGLWARAFGSDPAIIGRSVHLAGQSLEVVGIMPADFNYPATDIDAWKPFGMTPDQGGSRDSYWVSVVGRLAEGVTLEDAEAEMMAIGASLEERHPETNVGFRPLLEPLTDVAVLNARRGVFLLWGAVTLLIVVACANVATLLLARSEERTREMAIRCSIGAGRIALVRQLLCESVSLAGLGGVLGLVVAVPATEAVQRLLGARLSYGLSAELDLAVLGYSSLLTGLAGVAFGLLPAVRASGEGTSSARGRGTADHGPGRLGAFLISGQIALAVVVLVGAGLLGRSMIALASVDTGYPLGNALTFRVAAPREGVDRLAAARLLEEIRARVESLSGVTAVAATNNLPLSGNRWGSEWTDRRRVGETGLRASARVVQPGYLPTLGVPLLSGRTFTPLDDGTSEPVAVVSASAVSRYWPDEDPLGAYISLNPDDERAPWVRIVGVVGDVEATLGGGASPIVYTPFEQSVFGHFGDWGMDFVVRTSTDPRQVAPEIRAVVREAAPALPVFAVASMEELFAAQLEASRALGLLMAIFAGAALLLAALGVYGTLAYRVARQAPEIGVRMALGAQRPSVLAGILGRGLALAGIGLVAGLLVASAGGRWLDGLLFGVEPRDPSTYAGIALTLTAVALAASALPAWRAARIDPAAALRPE